MTNPTPVHLTPDQLQGAVRWTEETLPVQLSKEELEAVHERMKLLDELLKTGTKAKYKIEILFTKDRSMHRPTPGAVSFWESGSKLHGGGDGKLYICPGQSLGRNDCSSFIPDSANASSFLWCPRCGIRWQGTEVIGERLAVLPLKKWGEVLLHYFTKLENNADIYVKYAREDIRTKAMLEQARQQGGEKLEKVRNARAKSIYPLKNIVWDTSNGADLLGRFQAFLTA